MGNETGIQWTDATFNPWWGCSKVSPGCENCYAERDAARFGTQWGPKAERRFFGDKHWQDPETLNARAQREGRRARLFCASFADVFEDRPELWAQRARLWELVGRTPWVDWQILTKRPENIGRMIPAVTLAQPNVWLGATVEDQVRAEKRIPELLRYNAAVRFLSCEPILGPLDLRKWIDGVDWVIVGGESGPGARACELDDLRSVVAQCRASKTAVFVKQLGAKPRGDAAIYISDRKGGNMDDWPADLRIREMPRTDGP